VKGYFQRIFLCALTVAVAGIAASSALADTTSGGLLPTLIGGNCGATSTPFAAWGDDNAYYLTADGDFASGTAGWTLSGAELVPGAEPFLAHTSANDVSLLIGSGDSAISPPTCFGLLTPGVRLFAKSDAGPATLHVRIIAAGLLGVLSVLDGGTVSVGSSWAPTPVFSTTLSQLDVPVGTKSIRIEYTTTGDVQIDDSYIDPYQSR
jgi:hypothetical protein